MLASCACGQAVAACDPAAFLVQDHEHVIWTEQQKRSFLLMASKDQYDRAKSSWGGSAAYGPFSGNANYDQAKASALKELSLQAGSLSYQTHLEYTAQHLSPIGADAYGKCLEQDKERPGIQLWLHRREGELYTLRGYWVGLNAQEGTASNATVALADGVTVMMSPSSWPKGLTQEVLVRKRDANTDGVLVLHIGGLSKSLVLIRDVPQIQFASELVVSEPKIVRAGGGKSRDTCGYGGRNEAELCVKPSRPSGYLVPNTIGLVESSTHGGPTEVRVTRDREDSACVAIRASTGGCEYLVTIQGRASAVERYPVPTAAAVATAPAK